MEVEECEGREGGKQGEGVWWEGEEGKDRGRQAGVGGVYGGSRQGCMEGEREAGREGGGRKGGREGKNVVFRARYIHVPRRWGIVGRERGYNVTTL